MPVMDTARGWARLYELRTGKKYSPGGYFDMGKGKGGGGTGVKGVFLTIAEEVAVEKNTVWEYLQLLSQP